MDKEKPQDGVIDWASLANGYLTPTEEEVARDARIKALLEEPEQKGCDSPPPIPEG